MLILLHEMSMAPGMGIPINVPTPTFRRMNRPSFGGGGAGGFTSGKGF
ncbi:MAG: hypothetical protein KDA86_19075 [Planctomycetaceae bacterium]|nr:hypothetical protein [Planctomycetaceae bacterium]